MTDKVFGGEDGPKESDKVFVRDLWKGIVVNDGALTGIPGVDDPRARHSETRPYFAVLGSYARRFEPIAQTKGVGVSAQRCDEHGLYDARQGCGRGELGEEGEDMARCAPAGRVNCLGARRAAWKGMRGEEQRVREEHGPRRKNAQWSWGRVHVASESGHGRLVELVYPHSTARVQSLLPPQALINLAIHSRLLPIHFSFHSSLQVARTRRVHTPNTPK